MTLCRRRTTRELTESSFDDVTAGLTMMEDLEAVLERFIGDIARQVRPLGHGLATQFFHLFY